MDNRPGVVSAGDGDQRDHVVADVGAVGRHHQGIRCKLRPRDFSGGECLVASRTREAAVIAAAVLLVAGCSGTRRNGVAATPADNGCSLGVPSGCARSAASAPGAASVSTAALGGPAPPPTQASASRAAPSAASSRPVPGPFAVGIVDTGVAGRVLADLSGHPLYWRPRGGCSGPCQNGRVPALRPALSVGAPADVPSMLSTLRTGVGQQLTWAGSPLFTFAGDGGSGDLTGAVFGWRPVTIPN